MEKNTIKKVVLSAASAVVFASLSIGTTFALFTSTAKTEVQVSSGKINVAASVLDPKTYSAVADSQGELVDENGAHYRHDQQGTEEVQGVTRYLFSNTGYVTFSDTQRVINIDRITPGDKLVFSYDTTSDSNVSYKYRFSYKVVNDTSYESYLDLVKGLKTTIQKVGATDPIISTTGLVVYQSDWGIKTPTDELDNLQFTIELPMDVGNAYQNKSAKIAITFEAIQANAYTEDVEETTIIQQDVKSAETSVDTSKTSTSVNAGEVTVGQQTKAAFTVQVPHTDGQEATTTYHIGSQEEPVALADDDKIVVEVSDLGTTEKVYSTETSLNFDLTLKINGEEANNFSTALPVKIYVGEGKIISSVTHDGNPVNDFTYSEGYITFSTTSFSPFSVGYLDGVEVRNETELRAALANGGTIGLKDDITATTRFAITQSIRLVGFGHTINVTEGGENGRAFNLDGVNNLTVNLENVTINQSNTSATYSRGISAYNCSNITLNLLHAQIGSNYYAVSIASLCDNVTVNMSDSSVAGGWCAIQTWSNNTTFNINNSTLIGTNDKNYAASGGNNFGTIVVNPNAATGVVINLNSSTIEANYTGSAISGDNHNSQWAFLLKGNECVINSNNCTYKVNNEIIEIQDFGDLYPDLIAFTSYDAIEGLTFKLNGVTIYPDEQQ